ncbi:hypothetical protein GCM10009851_19310 [Herbiconiux moechotypicola]|uniref:ABC transporter permease n=1 Tax=Herbiconiux moechotypicola TaxID=637393 RepID=A0ABP5QJ16_9MICO
METEAGGVSGGLSRALRRPAWYVVYGVVLAASLVTAVVLWMFEGLSSGHMAGLVFSGVVYLVLGAAFVVVPLLGRVRGAELAGLTVPGGGSTGVLALWMVRFVLTLGLVAAAFPVLAIAALAGGVSIGTFVVALGVVVLELAVLTALVVGLAVLAARTALGVLLGYAAVAVLAVVTLVAAPLVGTVKDVTETVTTIPSEYDEESETVVCLDPVVTTEVTATALPNWVVLVLNPFVVVGDAAAGDVDEYGQPRDWFGTVATDLRQAHTPVPIERLDDECGENATGPLPEHPVAQLGAPLWYVGLAVHVVLGAGVLAAAVLVQRRRAGATRSA